MDELLDKLNKIKSKANMLTGWTNLGEALSELKEIDTILTKIGQTSDRTSESLKRLGERSFEAANMYGRKASEYLASVQEMNQNGIYGEKGDAMAEQSLLAQSAGNMAEETASRWILSADKAYGYNGGAEEINSMLDGVTNITNKNSVNMADIAEGMSIVGTSAAQAGVKVNELASILAASVAAAEKEGSEVGTAWEAIFANLQNTSSSRITETLDEANASMTEMVHGSEQLRNPIDILNELAETYNSLDAEDPLKTEIVQNIGGKGQADILDAFLSNYGQYSEMLQEYSAGSGAAMAQAEKSADNWEGSLNRLSNTWADTVDNFADSDGIVTLLNTFNSFLSVINKVTDTLGSFGSIGLGAGLLAGIKNVGRDKMFSLMF